MTFVIWALIDRLGPNIKAKKTTETDTWNRVQQNSLNVLKYSKFQYGDSNLHIHRETNKEHQGTWRLGQWLQITYGVEDPGYGEDSES